MQAGVGFSIIHENQIKAEKLLPYSSIFTAELYAIETAIDHGINRQLETVTVATDSKSSIQAIINTSSKHEIVKKIRSKSTEFNTNIQLCWTPSHVDIAGNEKADKEAKKIIDHDVISPKRIPRSDYKPLIKYAIKDKWREEWRALTRNKYRRLTENPQPLPGSCSRNRQWERTLARLRLGHSHLTHSFLMNSRESREPPHCDHCDLPVTIEHVLTECELFLGERRSCFSDDSPNLLDILSKNSDFNALYRYITMTNLYNQL